MKAPANVKGFSPAQNSVLSTFPFSNALPQAQGMLLLSHFQYRDSKDYIIFNRDARYKYLADTNEQIIIVMANKYGSPKKPCIFLFFLSSETTSSVDK